MPVIKAYVADQRRPGQYAFNQVVAENLSFRKKRYNVYYDKDGSVFAKGSGVIIEEIKS